MVSVCMATYNGEKYVAEQLRSILVQLQPTDEVIISDDGSTDHTCAIIESFQDARIQLLHNDSHHFKWNFHNALIHAKGDIIFLSDQDDVWMEGKYDRCVAELQNYDLVVTDNIVTDKDLQPIYPSFFQYYHSGTGLLKNSIKSTYYGSCMAFRKRVLQEALPFPKTNEIGHDIWIGLVGEMVGKVKFIPQPYLYYRRHDITETNPLGNLLTRSKRSIFIKIASRFITLIHITRFYITYHAKQFSQHHHAAV